ncbi:MAG: lipoprotein-releasing ABC transporter permease subunit [Chlamydiae bacterium]|nr:lipoprotein-releasing ABC transporter permease subunit [Chlamydiota bacterium]MBI3278127.1 lipoprotein-releasing ABC transporter permease subunit [Chlamydiota bacterium]
MLTRLPFSLFISVKYLRGRHRHRWISLINIFSIFGIALGVMALIVVLSVMGGFDRDLKKRVLGVYSPITVGGDHPIEEPQKVLDLLKGLPEVEAASPFVSGQILARVHEKVYGVFIRAIDPLLEEGTTSIQSYIAQGKFTFDTGSRKRGMIIGNEFAHLFHLKLGDTVELLSPVSIPTPLGLSSHALRFQVTGIFDSGMYEYDLNLIYISLELGEELYALGKSVSGISVNIRDSSDVFQIKQLIKDKIGKTVLVRTWLEMNKNLFRAVVTEKWMMFWILLLIILVAAFNISSSLIMMVMEKVKEVGILRALGATSGSILRIFLFQGFLIGAVGTFLGFAGGIFLSLNLNPIANAVKKWTGFEFFPRDVYYLDKIPALIDIKQSLLIALSALVLSLLAALYPAFQAARLKPVEAIRYE